MINHTQEVLSFCKKQIYTGIDLLSRGKGLERKINGDVFRFPSEGARFYPNVYQETKHKFIKENAKGVVVDLGAHIGLYSVLMSQTADHVLAFEPSNHTRKILSKTLQMNSCNNVEVRSELVGLENTTVNFIEINNNLSNANSMVGVEGRTIAKTQITLDSLNTQINFMKINIEGAELLALKGG